LRPKNDPEVEILDERQIAFEIHVQIMSSLRSAADKNATARSHVSSKATSLGQAEAVKPF
jgi:hypothetical protein